MAVIALTGGHLCEVDDEDLPELSKYTWSSLVQPNGRVYAVTRVRISAAGRNGGWKSLRMHRLLMGEPQGKVIDHRDGDTLNNRKVNLRICTQHQNGMNRRANSTGKKKSQYKGVTLSDWNRNPKWIASISPNGQRLYLGSFETEKEAAEVYDRAATEHFGPYANTNFAR